MRDAKAADMQKGRAMKTRPVHALDAPERARYWNSFRIICAF
jgi:hypothetical protein